MPHRRWRPSRRRRRCRRGRLRRPCHQLLGWRGCREPVRSSAVLPPLVRRRDGGALVLHRDAAGRAEEVQLMTEQARDIHATPVAGDKAAEGAHVYNAVGDDWDAIVDEASALREERIVVNMGPQHPSTHGVLRLILELDGETVTEARAGIGYLHTGIEKNMEFRNWTQGVTFCTRMDYVAPLFQQTAYSLGVEELLGITDDIPE